jgi:hypothetical protein
MPMEAKQIIELARRHVNKGTMSSSAKIALIDAIELEEEGRSIDAANRALSSLRYSVGVFHPDYQAAAAK